MSKTETIGGTTDPCGYTYDVPAGLADVRRNGSAVAHYDYDPNGNRIGGFTATQGSNLAATYDDQDRLFEYTTAVGGPTTYTYTANGELASTTNTTTSTTTTYTYDVLGNLRHVALPDGRRIDYVIDGRNGRVGKKKLDGGLVRQWLYKDQLNPIAELDGGGNLVAQFVYASKSNVPDYMIKGGVTYRLLSDHLGSPRLVVNVADGTSRAAHGLRRVRHRAARHEPGLPAVRVCGRTLRSRHEARALRGARLRSGNRAVDRQRPHPLRGQRWQPLRVRRK